MVTGNARKGSIDAAVMMKIFDTPIPQGGPSFPEGFTVYQIVAVPAEYMIWLKAHGYSGWEMIPVAKLFQ